MYWVQGNVLGNMLGNVLGADKVLGNVQGNPLGADKVLGNVEGNVLGADKVLGNVEGNPLGADSQNTYFRSQNSCGAAPLTPHPAPQLNSDLTQTQLKLAQYSTQVKLDSSQTCPKLN